MVENHPLRGGSRLVFVLTRRPKRGQTRNRDTLPDHGFPFATSDVVDTNAARLPPKPDDPVELINDLVSPKVHPRRCRESRSRMTIHNRQNPERLVVKEPVRHEIHRPDIVHRTGLCARRAVAARVPPP